MPTWKHEEATTQDQGVISLRDIIFIGRKGCNACEYQRETVIEPLRQKYPDNVSVHYNWDDVIARVNADKKITRIPLTVVAHDGCEEFRYDGALTFEELEAIIKCDASTLTLDEVIA